MKVEVLVGLRDAMAPDESVPLPGQSSRPAKATPSTDDASTSRAENACEPNEATEANPGDLLTAFLQRTLLAGHMRLVCNQITCRLSDQTCLICQKDGLMEIVWV